MERDTLTLWNFMFLSYKHNLTEKQIQILGKVLDPKTDLGAVLGDMEDKLSVADRTAINSMIHDKIMPLLKDLSDENFISGISLLTDIMQPIIVRLMKKASSDPAQMSENIQVATRLASSLKTIMALMAPTIIDLIIKKKKPAWTMRFVLRKIRKKLLIAKGDIIK